MTARRLGLWLIALAACTGTVEEPAAGPTRPDLDRDPLTEVPTDFGDPVESGLGSPPHRPRRRMDLDQLEASVVRVTGGIGWTERRGGRDVGVFQSLAATLGRPDWVQITEEDLEPTALFQKFLDDMARDVCSRLATAERTRPEADRRLLVEVDATTTVETGRAGVDRNLAALLLAYHGRVVDPCSTELDPWRDLFMTAAVADDDPVLGWRAVCVGLMTHPDFYSY